MRSRLAVGRRVGAGLVIAMLAAWAPAGVAHAGAPTQRYIVTYGAQGLAPLEAAHTAAAAVEQALPDDGSRVERTYATLPAVAVTATAAGKAALEAEPGVTSVTPDIQFHVPDDGAAPSSLAATAPTALTPVTGQGWTVAVVDTGVDTSHPYVAGRTSTGFDGHGDVGGCFTMSNCPGGGSTEFGLAAAQPCPGAGCDHGTHVAGIAIGAQNVGGPGGVAPQAGLYPVRVFTVQPDGSSTAMESDVIAALQHIAVESPHYHFASVNLSLGGSSTFPVPCTGVEPAMEAAIQQLDAQGIAVTVASGNHGSTTGVSFPACASGAISVGALDTSGQVASFSDAVSGLSLVAPGTAIVSSVPGGGFAQKSGTSMAAPVVAGAFALARQASPSASLDGLLQLFRSTATPAPDPRVTNTTYPDINLAAALANLGASPPSSGTGTSFHGLATPQRLVDTRIAGGPVAAGGTLDVTVPNVPTTGAASPAVSLNVTSVGATGPGFLTVYPCGQPQPVVSNVNFTGAPPVANKVIVAVPPSGQVCVFSLVATNVVVDMDGWLEPGHPFNAVAPNRVIDTRQTGVKVTDVNVPVAPAGATAAVVNVTITEPVTAGFATLYPCGSAVPLASNVNFRAGETVPGSALVPVDTLGHLCVHTSTLAHVLVDVDGYLTNGFTPTGPSRAVDTRALSQKVTDVVLSPVGLAGASGFALTLTVTEPTAAGFATVYPCGQQPPVVSNINFVAGQTVANAVVATPNAQGQMCIHSAVPTHLVIDVSGFFN